MENNYITKAGVTFYYKPGGGRNRYGDYTGTGVDPTDNSFWNFSEWLIAEVIGVPSSPTYTPLQVWGFQIYQKIMGIKIYPNPFNDDVLITFSASIQNNSFTLKIANSIGQLMIEKLISAAEVMDGYILNTSAFAKGIYTLSIQNEQGQLIKKIIKE